MGRKYKAIYKCRLCKEEFENGIYSDAIKMHLSKISCATHFCKDGRCGIGDVIGLCEIPISKEEAEKDANFNRMLYEVLG